MICWNWEDGRRSSFPRRALALRRRRRRLLSLISSLCRLQGRLPPLSETNDLEPETI